MTPPYKGNITETQETLNEWVERVHRAGIQVNCHANGDVAIDMYLTAAERALKLLPRANARPKITHCTLVNPSLVARIKAIGAVPAMFTTYAYYNPDKFVYYGEEMMKSCMAYRSLLDAGVYACAGSDFSPGPFAALMGIQGMVTRKGWDGKTWGANQKITVSEAIAVNTYNGAWASGEERIKGSITAGKLADYVVLANDPHTVDVGEDQGHPDRPHGGGRQGLPPGVGGPPGPPAEPLAATFRRGAVRRRPSVFTACPATLMPLPVTVSRCHRPETTAVCVIVGLPPFLYRASIVVRLTRLNV